MPSAKDRLRTDVPGKRWLPWRKKATAKPARKVKPVKGATRKAGQEAPKVRQPSIWLNRVLVGIALGVVIAAGSKAWITLDALPVKRITVTGQLEHTQAEAVQDLVQASLAGGFLSADLQLMRAQLESLPWIFEATVRRRWPNALEIHVVEQLPIARWGADSFLNHEGGIFSSDRPGDWQSLPVLRGPQGTAPALMEKYQRMVELLLPIGLRVYELNVDERGQVTAVVDNEMQISLGGVDFRQRMQRFVALYSQELIGRRQQIERVDLRYKSGVAVAYKEKEEDTSQVAGL